MDSERRPTTIAFLAAAIEQLDGGMQKIRHCLDQLDELQIWRRPQPWTVQDGAEAATHSGEAAQQPVPMNSIANILLHLNGNLRQWLVSGLTDIEDDRIRQAEFDDESGRPSAELLEELEGTIDRAREIILSLDDHQVLTQRLVQEFHCSGAQVLWDSIAHFRGHVQEIVHITRMHLGAEYKFDFVPRDQRPE